MGHIIWPRAPSIFHRALESWPIRDFALIRMTHIIWVIYKAVTVGTFVSDLLTRLFINFESQLSIIQATAKSSLNQIKFLNILLRPTSYNTFAWFLLLPNIHFTWFILIIKLFNIPYLYIFVSRYSCITALEFQIRDSIGFLRLRTKLTLWPFSTSIKLRLLLAILTRLKYFSQRLRRKCDFGSELKID